MDGGGVSGAGTARGGGDWLRAYDRAAAMVPRVEALAAGRARLEAINGIQHEFWEARDVLLQCRLLKADESRRRWEAAYMELQPSGDDGRFLELQNSDLEDLQTFVDLLDAENTEFKIEVKEVEGGAEHCQNAAEYEHIAGDVKAALRQLKQGYEALCSEKDKEVSALIAEKNKEVSTLIAEKDKEVSALIGEKDKEVSALISEKNKEVSALIAEKDFVQEQFRTLERDYADLGSYNSKQAAQLTEEKQELEQLQVTSQKKDDDIRRLRARAKAVEAKRKLLPEDKLQEIPCMAKETDGQTCKDRQPETGQKSKKVMRETHNKNCSEDPALRREEIKKYFSKQMLAKDGQPQTGQKRKCVTFLSNDNNEQNANDEQTSNQVLEPLKKKWVPGKGEAEQDDSKAKLANGNSNGAPVVLSDVDEASSMPVGEPTRVSKGPLPETRQTSEGASNPAASEAGTIGVEANTEMQPPGREAQHSKLLAGNTDAGLSNPLDNPSLDVIEGTSRLGELDTSCADYWAYMQEGFQALMSKQLQREDQVAQWAKRLKDKAASLDAAVALTQERHFEKDSILAFREDKLMRAQAALEKERLDFACERDQRWRELNKVAELQDLQIQTVKAQTQDLDAGEQALGAKIEQARQEASAQHKLYLAAKQQEHDGQMQQLCRELKAAQERFEKSLANKGKLLEDHVSRVTTQVVATNSAVQDLPKNIAPLVATTERLKKSLADHEAKYRSLETSSATKEEEVAAAKDKLTHLQQDLDDAVKKHQKAEAEFADVGASVKADMVALREIATSATAVMIEMGLKHIDLPTDAEHDKLESFSAFFLGMVTELKSFQEKWPARRLEMGKEICQPVCRFVLSRLKYHNPDLNLRTLYDPIVDAADKERAEASVQKHAHKISTVLTYI